MPWILPSKDLAAGTTCWGTLCSRDEGVGSMVVHVYAMRAIHSLEGAPNSAETKTSISDKQTRCRSTPKLCCGLDGKVGQ